MPRNLERRVEILFPVEETSLRDEVKNILLAELKDNMKAHVLQIDGKYEKINRRGKAAFDSQSYFCKRAQEAMDTMSNTHSNERIFVPEIRIEENNEKRI